VDETRPRLQGARLTAWELIQEGISHELIVDSAAAVLMAAGKVDYCVVGADRIAADGSVANKIGTYSLAVNAKFHDVPFIVVAPVSTVDLACANGRDIPIEERDADEVTHPCGAAFPRVAPEATPVYNPAFDVTPPNLVSFIVTDHGLATQKNFKEDLAALCSKATDPSQK
jgi:methylthioribose-1-phosphate isomerase